MTSFVSVIIIAENLWYIVIVTFGMEHGEVVEHIECPRCHASAVIRAQAFGEDSFSNSITCPKCHLIKFVNITSKEYVDLKKRINSLERLLARATTKRQVQRLSRNLEELREEAVLHETISDRQI